MDKKPDLITLSLGAGVQSTCLYLMACQGEILPRPDVAIFSDTGWEPPEVYEHLEKLKANGSIPINIVSGGNIRDDVINYVTSWRKDGSGWLRGQPPMYARIPDEVSKMNNKEPDKGGPLWRKCTEKYKIKPIQNEIRRLLGYKKGQHVRKLAYQYFGISSDEMQRMKDSRTTWIDNRYPLVDMRMNRTKCIDWLEKNNWHNVEKSACIGCPYHDNKMWEHMKNNRPEQWADAVEFDKAMRDGPYPHTKGQVYLHPNMIPLDQVELSTAEDRGQLSFLDECEGMCGV